MVSKYLYLHFDGVLLGENRKQENVYASVSLKSAELITRPEVMASIEIPLDCQQFTLTIMSKSAPLYGAIKFIVQDVLNLAQEKPTLIKTPLSSSPLYYDPKSKIQAKYPVALVTVELKPEKIVTMAYEEDLVVEGNNLVLQSILKELLDLSKEVVVINKKPLDDLPDVLKHKTTLADTIYQADASIADSNDKISRIQKIKDSLNVYTEKQKAELEEVKKLLTDINSKLIAYGKVNKDICGESQSLSESINEGRYKFKDFMNHANELKTLSFRLEELKANITLVKAKNSKDQDTLITHINAIQDIVVNLTKNCLNARAEIERTKELSSAHLQAQSEAKDSVNIKQANLDKVLLDCETVRNSLIDANRRINEEKQKISCLKENHQDAITLMKFKINKEQKLIDESKKNNANYIELSGKVSQEIKQEEAIGIKNKNAVITVNNESISTEKSEEERDQIMKNSNQVQFDDYNVKLSNCTTSGNEADNVANIKEKLAYLVQTREEMTFKIVDIQERINSTTEKIAQIKENIIALNKQNQSIVAKTESILAQYDIALKRLAEMKQDETDYASKNISTKTAISERQAFLMNKEDSLKELEQRVSSLSFSINENNQLYQQHIDQLRQLNASIDEIKGTIKMNASLHESKMLEKNSERNHLQQVLDSLNLELEKIKDEKRQKEVLYNKAYDTYIDLDDRLYALEIDNGKETYKAYIGDAIDAKIAEFLRRHRSIVPFKRVDKGIYLYGTMKIQAMVQKNKIVFNVQHNLISIEDLIRSYGDIELVKLKKLGTSPKADMLASSPIRTIGGESPDSLRANLTKSLLEKGAIVVDSPGSRIPKAISPKATSPKAQSPKKSPNQSNSYKNITHPGV